MKPCAKSTKKLSNKLYDGIPRYLKMFLERLESVNCRMEIKHQHQSQRPQRSEWHHPNRGMQRRGKGLFKTRLCGQPDSEQESATFCSNAPRIYKRWMLSLGGNQWRNLQIRSQERNSISECVRQTTLFQDSNIQDHHWFKSTVSYKRKTHYLNWMTTWPVWTGM